MVQVTKTSNNTTSYVHVMSCMLAIIYLPLGDKTSAYRALNLKTSTRRLTFVFSCRMFTCQKSKQTDKVPAYRSLLFSDRKQFTSLASKVYVLVYMLSDTD